MVLAPGFRSSALRTRAGCGGQDCRNYCEIRYCMVKFLLLVDWLACADGSVILFSMAFAGKLSDHVPSEPQTRPPSSPSRRRQRTRELEDRRYRVAERQCAELLGSPAEQRVGAADHERGCAPLRRCCKGRFEVAFAARRGGHEALSRGCRPRPASLSKRPRTLISVLLMLSPRPAGAP